MVHKESPKAAAPVGGISVTVHIWITWANLAIEHEQESAQARLAFLAARSAGDMSGDWLGRESAEGLIAICSAAFAMEALIVTWARIVMDAQTVAKWESREGRRQATSARVEEVLKRCLGDKSQAESLRNRWAIVFDQRGNAIHFGEEASSLVTHPAPGIGSVAHYHVQYSPESAASAVTLLIETLDAVETAQRPKLYAWNATMAPTLQALRSKRQAAK